MDNPHIGVTTVERNADRANVSPYAPRPVVDFQPGRVVCTFCGNDTFRRSRLRFEDLREFFKFRYPLRCTRCNQRQFNEFLVALASGAPRPHVARVSVGDETWKSWTGQSESGTPVPRPMSTVIGTRARKLEEISPDGARTRPRPRRHHDQDDVW